MSAKCAKNMDEQQVKADTTALMLQMTKPKIDKEVFVDVFTCRSLQHLARVAAQFKLSADQELLYALNQRFKASSESGLACRTLLRYATARHDVFCHLLDQVMRSPGLNYENLTWFVVEHCEMDLATIVERFGAVKLRQWLDRHFQRGRLHSQYYHFILRLCGL